MNTENEKPLYEEMVNLIEADLESYPPTLQAKHISQYMGVSLGTAYKLLKSEDFAAITVPDSKFILVPKSVFTKWYAARLCKKQLDEMECEGV